MKMKLGHSKSAKSRNQNGFTLIEMIATLLLSSVLIAMLLPLIGSGFRGNQRALLAMRATQNLRSEMDALWGAYRASNPVDLPALSAKVNAEANTTPPPSYNVLFNDWVDFDDSGAEITAPPGTEKTLRVTLGNNNGEVLTAYFFADQS